MIAKMRLINLTADKNRIDDLLAKFVDYEGFHPVEANQIAQSVHGAINYESANPCEPLIKELEEIEQVFGIELKAEKTRILKDSIDDMHQYIVDSHQVFSTEFSRIKKLESVNESYKKAIEQIENIEDLELSFDDLFKTKFVSLRIGKLPLSSVERLRYYNHKPFIFVPFNEDKEHDEMWCLYLMSNEYEREIDNLFTSLYFERIHIPDFVHGTPGTAKKALHDLVIENATYIEESKKDLKALALQYQDRLAQIKSELEFLSKMYQAKKYMVGLGDRVSISGFIEKTEVNKLEKHFGDVPTLEIDVRPALSDKRLTPPTKFKNNWFTRPFQVFVEMYGIPTYGDVDPTTFMAISYTLLFGIMFGDLGQGLLLALVGYLLGRFKKWSLGPIVTRIGLSGAFFGLIYGEFFGNETFLHPLYEWLHELGIGFLPFVPMDTSNTMNLLLGTVALGAGFIIISIVVNMMFKFKHKDYAEAICSPNGVSGLIFYGYVLLGIVLQMLFNLQNVFAWYILIPFAVLPILLIFLKEPIHRKLHHEKMFPDGVGGFFMEGFFELFEVILSYVTNTLSFLRVGGFVLSHAGLMMVVKVLANGGENIFAMILGNLFVMGLEGLIVGIQVLRLEFYEMFSRYYDGDGIAFSPIA